MGKKRPMKGVKRRAKLERFLILSCFKHHESDPKFRAEILARDYPAANKYVRQQLTAAGVDLREATGDPDDLGAIRLPDLDVFIELKGFQDSNWASVIRAQTYTPAERQLLARRR